MKKEQKPMGDFLSSVDKKVEEIKKTIGSLTEVEQKTMGTDVLESIDAILSICKQIMGATPYYKTDDNNNVILDHMNMPEVITYSFEQFNIKQLIDFQFQLAGHLGFISGKMAEFKGNAGLKKAIIDISSNYIYSDVKNYIRDILSERATDKHIESIINTSPAMLKAYSNQRVSASVAVILETVCRAGELLRNVLNSTIDYLKADLINSMHLSKGILQDS